MSSAFVLGSADMNTKKSSDNFGNPANVRLSFEFCFVAFRIGFPNIRNTVLLARIGRQALSEGWEMIEESKYR